jgi:hypothetical protein
MIACDSSKCGLQRKGESLLEFSRDRGIGENPLIEVIQLNQCGELGFCFVKILRHVRFGRSNVTGAFHY